jgi:hypothetical protein
MPLEFDKDHTRLSVTASVRLLKKSPIPIVFIVDTGSPETFIDEFITKDVRVSTDNLDFDHHALLAGTKIGMYRLGSSTISFRTSNDSLQKFEFTKLMLARSLWRRKEAIYAPVSILGLNFFLETKTSLHVDPANNEAYIEWFS